MRSHPSMFRFLPFPSTDLSLPI